MSRKKRILFVTHALESCYGASTSLRLLLENYTTGEADLVVPRSLRRPRNLAATASLYPAVRNVYELFLPTDLDLVGIRLPMMDQAHELLHRTGWRWDRPRFLDLLRRNDYDVVHFNSPVLHQLIEPGIPAITHIRDIIVDPRSSVVDKLSTGMGIVFIDNATRRPFERVLDRVPSIVLNNPIDMSDVSENHGVSHPRLAPSTTVFSIIGRIGEIKGVDLVIRAFKEGAQEDSLLLIVGDGHPGYVAHCRVIADKDPRIVFWGEEKNVNKIYASTHHVVRGDPQGCIGRTVYEGLYSGCHIIMPGLGEPDFLFEAERFRNDIRLYRSRDIESLTAAFASSSRNKPQKRVGMSNVHEHVREFDAFLDYCLENEVTRRTPSFPRKVSDRTDVMSFSAHLHI